MKDYLGFVLGIIIGCVGLLVAQQLTRPEGRPPQEEPETGTPLVSQRQTQQLADARERITELEQELASAQAASADTEAVAAADDGSGEGKNENGEGEPSFLEVMMSLGDTKAKREIEKEVMRLTGSLGLSDNQQAVLRAALEQKLADQKAAGMKLFSGKAIIDDLITSDEHNFTAVDAALQAVLDEEQLALYEGVQAEREAGRIGAKVGEELGNLANATDLSDDQREAAWEVLAEISAGEKPGGVPEGTTAEQFMAIIDQALDKRIGGMATILNEEQMEVYGGQMSDFRTFVGSIVGMTNGESPE